MSVQKRKRVLLTIQQKIDIIQKLHEGKSARKLAQEYGIGVNTVHDVRRNKDKLLQYYSSASDLLYGFQNRRTMKKSPYELLNRALLQWFNSERALGHPITGPMCVKQAKVLFETLGMEGNFDASSGWLARFKDRHGIRTVGDTMDCMWSKSDTCQVLAENDTDSSKAFETNEGESSKEGGDLDTRQLAVVEGDCEDALLEKERTLTSPEQLKGVEDPQASPDVDENTIHTKPLEGIEVQDEKEIDCDFTNLKSVVKKLEAITEKFAANTLEDSYDHFGKYISSLLRGLPPKKVLSLKQKIVTDILDVLLAHEKGISEDSLSIVTPNSPANEMNKSMKSLPRNTSKKPRISSSANPSVGSGTSSQSSEPFSSPVVEKPHVQANTSVLSISTSLGQKLRNTQSVLKGNLSRFLSRETSSSSFNLFVPNPSSCGETRGVTSSASNNYIDTVPFFPDGTHLEDTLSTRSTSEDELKMDVEDGKQLIEIKQDQDQFEMVICNADTFVQVKQEPPDQEEGITDCEEEPEHLFICDHCSFHCATRPEITEHLLQLHSDCILPFENKLEDVLTLDPENR